MKNVTLLIISNIGLRITNILFSLDCFLWTLMTNLFGIAPGFPFESFSSAAYRAELMGLLYGKSRPIIDALFSLLGQKEHCKWAYLNAKQNLPEDQR